MRGAPLRIDPHETQLSKLSRDETTARMEFKARLANDDFMKRWKAGDAAEVKEMTLLHRAKTERQAGGVDWDGSGGGTGKSGAAGWTEAVTKLIPAEVVAAYLAGKAALALLSMNDTSIWAVWTVICFLMVILFRSWMTSDKRPDAKVPVEWSAVFVSAASFLVWVYSLGDVFKMLMPGYWSAENATHLLMAWTIACPAILLILKRKLAIP